MRQGNIVDCWATLAAIHLTIQFCSTHLPLRSWQLLQELGELRCSLKLVLRRRICAARRFQTCSRMGDSTRTPTRAHASWVSPHGYLNALPNPLNARTSGASTLSPLRMDPSPSAPEGL